MERPPDRRTILDRLKDFLSGPIWQGIKAILDILGLVRSLAILGILGLFGGAIAKFWRGILVIIGNAIETPLGRFSTILFFVSLLGVFLFRHEVRKVKVAIAASVLLALSLGGFTASGVIHHNSRIPEDRTLKITQLENQTDALQKELVTARETIYQKDNEKEKLAKQVEMLRQQNKTYRDTIQQKENENTLVKQEKEKLAKEVETQKQQNKTYADTIAQKDKEISNSNKQLSDSLSESKKLGNKISLLEKENRDFQVEISNLRKTSIPQQVSFEYTNKKLFFNNGDKRTELLTDYSILQFSVSKGRGKIAVIGGKGSSYCVIVFNADRDLTDLSVWDIDYHANTPPKNLKWVSDTVLRIDLISYFQQGAYPKFNNISLEGTGTYDITINEINSLMSIKRVDIGRK